MNDDELFDALGDALAPPDRPVPAEGLAAVRAQAAGAGSGAAPRAAGASRRTILLGSVAAAVGAAVGIAGTVAATSGDDAPDGPPTRPVEFAEVPAGTSVTGRTIDHTWGMELLLDVSGLPVDRDYTVTYATAEGEVGAGGFRSVAVPMVCRFNGTALRSTVTEIAISDQASGEIVLRGRPV